MKLRIKIPGNDVILNVKRLKFLINKKRYNKNNSDVKFYLNDLIYCVIKSYNSTGTITLEFFKKILLRDYKNGKYAHKIRFYLYISYKSFLIYLLMKYNINNINN